MRKLSLCLLLAISLPATAQIYRYKDAQGNTVFTDKLPPDAKVEQVDITPINSIPAPPTTASSNTSSSSEKDKNTESTAVFSVFQIDNLPTEDAIRANNGSFSFNVTTVPAISPSIQLQLLIDGEAYGSPISGNSFSVSELDRGDHQVAVQALVNGNVVQTTSSLTVTVQRVHLPPPARPKPKS